MPKPQNNSFFLTSEIFNLGDRKKGDVSSAIKRKKRKGKYNWGQSLYNISSKRANVSISFSQQARARTGSSMNYLKKKNQQNQKPVTRTIRGQVTACRNWRAVFQSINTKKLKYSCGQPWSFYKFLGF